MIRSIAKVLIQYFYDSSSSLSKAGVRRVDPLPRWLRHWTTWDLQLAKFERELGQLEGKLVSQSESHLKTWSESSDRPQYASFANSTTAHATIAHATIAHATIAKSASTSTWASKPVAMAALAAGLAGVLLAGGWIVWKPGAGLPISDKVVSNEPSKKGTVKTAEADIDAQNRREQIVRSSWEATKRLASGLRQKSGQANHTLAFANPNTIDHQIRETGGKGLRFVAQKLPQATVRMLGMNAHRHVDAGQ